MKLHSVLARATKASPFKWMICVMNPTLSRTRGDIGDIAFLELDPGTRLVVRPSERLSTMYETELPRAVLTLRRTIFKPV